MAHLRNCSPVPGDAFTMGASSPSRAAHMFMHAALVMLIALLAFPMAVRAAEPGILAPDDPASVRYFGYSAAADGNLAVVMGEKLNDTDGAYHDTAYVFAREGGTWNEVAQLRPPQGSPDRRFGPAVAMDDDTIVVGASDEIVSGLTEAGAVYVFERGDSVSEWSLAARLTAGDPREHVRFGLMVRIEGDTIVVGTLREGTADRFPEGAVYVFAFDAASGQWQQQAKLESPPEYQPRVFGRSAGLSGDTLAMNADGSHDIVIYERGTAGWTRTATVTPAINGHSGASIGDYIHIEGDTMAVSAPNNHDPNDPDDRFGRVHMYERGDAGWQETAVLAGPDGGSAGVNVFLENGILVSGERVTSDRTYLFRENSTGEWQHAATLHRPDDGQWQPVALSAHTLFIYDYENVLAYKLDDLLPGGVDSPDDEPGNDNGDDGSGNDNGDDGGNDNGNDDTNDDTNDDSASTGDDAGNGGDANGDDAVGDNGDSTGAAGDDDSGSSDGDTDDGGDQTAGDGDDTRGVGGENDAGNDGDSGGGAAGGLLLAMMLALRGLRRFR